MRIVVHFSHQNLMLTKSVLNTCDRNLLETWVSKCLKQFILNVCFKHVFIVV